MAWPTASEMWESTGWWSLLGVCPSPSLLAASELQSLDCRVQTVLEKGVWNAKSVLHVSMKLHNNSLRTSLRTVSLMSFLNCKFVLTAPRCNENIILSNKIGVCSCYENITLSVLRKHYLVNVIKILLCQSRQEFVHVMKTLLCQSRQEFAELWYPHCLTAGWCVVNGTKLGAGGLFSWIVQSLRIKTLNDLCMEFEFCV